jgi:hypothetical protein
MNLKHLTDETLDADIKMLAKAEREVLGKILWHLNEIDRRKLYCDSKCGSLYEYCIKVLKYSEGQASRRVTASRLLKTVPEIQVPIQKGDINLTQLGMINSHVKELELSSPAEEKKAIIDIIDEVKGKSTRETDKILREKNDEKPRKVNLKLEQTTVDKLYVVRGLKGHVVGDMDDLLNLMSDELIKLWDPTIVKRKTNVAAGESRYVAVGTKAKVWKRDQGKCTNCGSSFAIQVDHIEPFSRGGQSRASNFQLLCRNCNQRKADGVHVNRTTIRR